MVVADFRLLWTEIIRFPGLAEMLGVFERGLVENETCSCLISGDTAYRITAEGDGVFGLARSERGREEPLFRTNDVRALVVQLAYRALSRVGVFYPGHSPYEEIPFVFSVEQRRELDEYEIERIVIRWLWDDGRWAEILRKDSLLEGLKWAWMFIASDQTIANAVALRDGWPLFRPEPGPGIARPRGDLQNLTLEEWRAWRQEELEGEHDG